MANFVDHLVLQQLDLPTGAEWPVTPAGWCLVRMTVGAGYCFEDRQAIEINPGDVLVVPPGRAIVFRASQIGDVKLHYFHFQPEFLNSLLTLMERNRFAVLAASPDRRVSHLPAAHGCAREFGRLCKTAAREAPLLARCQMLKLAATMFTPVLKPLVRPPSLSVGARVRFIELMEQTPEAEVLKHSPEELARQCHCSVRHFKRLFLAHFGVSLRARQMGLRLETARQRLCETNAMVRDVARDSNYRNLGLFNAMFKRQFGMTPTELRRQQSGPPAHVFKNNPPSSPAPGNSSI